MSLTSTLAMSAPSATKPTVVRYGRWGWQFIAAPVGLALAIVFWQGRDNSLGFWVCMIFLGFLVVFGVVRIETQFDIANRNLVRQWKLFGFFTIFRKRLPLNQFRQICWRCHKAVDPSDWTTWLVGLERISGRPVYVNFFSVTHYGVCEEAKQFAVELSQATGLPLSLEIYAA